MKFRIPVTAIIASLALLASCSEGAMEISREELKDKIAGAWLGQMVGNIYGLEYENKFIEAAGEPPFVFNKAMRKMSAVDGAFSDDDTDVEYLYLLMMEKYGVDPTYAQIREGWMYHIRDRVWLANRATLGLMHYGLTPPFTGDMRYNPHWFQIDPQLINEIWSYTAPGMPAYAAGISEWAARITSDSWATSPTVVYGAMYSEAFFEKDIKTLVEHSKKYLPKGDRFRTIIDECLSLYKRYPDDWHAARQYIADKYYVNEADATKTIWNADLNGAMGILALLYGNGDIDKTLLIGCALGFDADNQTATICGLLGVVNGASAVPTDRSMPFEHWTKPFNDRYINVTRYDMPDASIEDIIERTVVLAEKIIVKNGGESFERDGQTWYRINPKAAFHAPLEFCVGPNPRIVVGEETDYDFACVTNRCYQWSLVGGTLPEGLSFKDGRLYGKALKTGDYKITLRLSDGVKSIDKEFDLVVRGRNIAPENAEILSLVKETNFEVLDSCWTTVAHSFYAPNVDVICDGVYDGPGASFYSLADKYIGPKEDYFGYRWAEPVTVDMLSFHFGCLEEFGGWYSTMRVEALDADGNWVEVPATISPARPESDAVFIQPHSSEFLFRFAEPVTTTAIRVIGDDAVLVHWNKYTKNVSSFISVSEIEVYSAR
ncbi:MAG: ADP-ribosylglycohydrolase family protein [Bacteroidales bacterium]|nr:ADP-ribosylglycohydrolase family protein [Candidatus Cryptobacteroides aphodequi]